jgi:nucleotidyltransferase substrate binding protein (TIGR01987 family)
MEQLLQALLFLLERSRVQKPHPLYLYGVYHMAADIRWQQRFSNYKKALGQLEEFVAKASLNKFEKQGLVQCFEYTFELGWKTLKDYLEAEGYTAQSPRSAIQLAFQSGLIENGHAWIDALEKRNLMSHTYNEDFITLAEALILGSYFGMLKQLSEKFESLSNS